MLCFFIVASCDFAAEFLSSMSRQEEACEQRIKAAELSPSDYSLAVAAATALRLLDRKNEAEKWYRTVRIYFYSSLFCVRVQWICAMIYTLLHGMSRCVCNAHCAWYKAMRTGARSRK